MEPMIIRYVRMSDGTKVEMCPTSEGIEIVAEDGRILFHVRQIGGGLEISTGSVCKNGGMMLSESLCVRPHARNSILIARDAYEK